MQIEQELSQLAPDKDTLLTVGVFDGVHLGHKHLISQLKEQARGRDLLSGVVTFRQHPLAVLSPETQISFLTDLGQRVALLEDEGVDIVATLSFSHEVADLGAREFITLLRKYLRMQGLVIGYDFALGRGRGGDADALLALGRDMGFTVTVISPVTVGDEVASSTAIRNALADGDMKRAYKLLGRYFGLHGPITAGVGRGAGLGFPTANMAVNSQQALPPDGVYATLAYMDDTAYPSMTNIGRRPTFGGGERTIEVYILDYDGDLYEHELRIDIVERLRGEKGFGSAKELKRQIARDVKKGRAILDSQAKTGY